MQPPGIMPPSLESARDLVAVWSRSLPIKNHPIVSLTGLCPADTLLVWFPAHWAPMVTRKLHEREQEFREANNLWFDQPGTEAHLRLKKNEGP